MQKWIVFHDFSINLNNIRSFGKTIKVNGFYELYFTYAGLEFRYVTDNRYSEKDADKCLKSILDFIESNHSVLVYTKRFPKMSEDTQEPVSSIGRRLEP
jgi:hypothetical protein